jgi:hypothetical protein
MSTTRRNALLIQVLICLLADGCRQVKDMGKTLGSLGEVRSEIINKFGEDNVDLRINSVTGHSTISITFINSHLNEKTSKDRDRRAQQTVEIVKSRFPQINSVDEIYVLFSRVTTSLVIFRSAIIIDYFAFDKDGKPVHGVFDSAQNLPRRRSRRTCANAAGELLPGSEPD